MKIIIDRFEGDFAVVETPDKTFFNVPKALLSEFSEGDIVEIKKDACETEEIKKSAEDAFNALFKK